MKAGIDLGFRVNVRAMVMKGDKVVREYPMQHNLILDTGMEALATKYTTTCFETACVGTGTTPTERGSGTTTVSATGGTATATAGFFAASDVGKSLYFTSTNEYAMITGFTSTVQVSISITTVIATQVATVYSVDQTQLDSYTVGSSTYRNTGNDENGDSSTIDNGVDWLIKRWRTFQFPVETVAATYTEGGWTWELVAVTNPTLFGRIVFSTPVSVGVGEFLLLYVELNTWIDCSVNTIVALPIDNLAVGAQSTVRPSTSYDYYDEVSADGSSYHSNALNYKGGMVEPSVDVGDANVDKMPFHLTSDSTVITSDPAPENGGQVYIVPDTYVPNSYQKVFDCFWTGADLDLTTSWYDIRVANIGTNSWSCFRILFDAVQSKTYEDVVRLIFTKSWSRDLS